MCILRLEDVGFSANGINILNNVTIEVEKGACISMVGKSGSGKSTLLKIIADLISATSGQLIFNEMNFNEYDPVELRRKISYCTQQPHLFGKTVRENLEYPFRIRKQQINFEIIESLLERFNFNLDMLDKDVISLSGGEKQRIALIRNLVIVPEIILLDESTSALDNENALLVEEYIQELNSKGVTIIWITHNEEQSKRIFKKRIVLENGEILAVEDLKHE